MAKILGRSTNCTPLLKMLGLAKGHILALTNGSRQNPFQHKPPTSLCGGTIHKPLHLVSWYTVSYGDAVGHPLRRDVLFNICCLRVGQQVIIRNTPILLSCRVHFRQLLLGQVSAVDKLVIYVHRLRLRQPRVRKLP
jgi:hypothetical protein